MDSEKREWFVVLGEQITHFLHIQWQEAEQGHLLRERAFWMFERIREDTK